MMEIESILDGSNLYEQSMEYQTGEGHLVEIHHHNTPFEYIMKLN